MKNWRQRGGFRLCRSKIPQIWALALALLFIHSYRDRGQGNRKEIPWIATDVSLGTFEHSRSECRLSDREASESRRDVTVCSPARKCRGPAANNTESRQGRHKKFRWGRFPTGRVSCAGQVGCPPGVASKSLWRPLRDSTVKRSAPRHFRAGLQAVASLRDWTSC